MKATFRKKIQLKSGEAYLRLKVPQKREEIQRYLNGEKFDPFINERIDEYLKKIGVYNESKGLTDIGKKVKESGILYSLQEGKYRFWFCENDTFLQTVILCTLRVPPQREDPENYTNDKKLNLKEKNIELNRNYIQEREGYPNFELVNTQVQLTEVTNNSSVLELEWHWEDFENNKSFLRFKGTIMQDKNETIPVYEEKINIEVNLEEFIKKIINEWNDKTKKLKVRFENIKNNTSEIELFVRNKQKFNNQDHLNFESIEFTEIPLEPYDDISAQEWSDELIHIHVEQNYLHENQIKSLLESNKKNYFANFNISIPPKPFDYYLQKFKNKSKAFWHIAAVHDLNLDNNMITNSFTLSNGQKISLKAISQTIIQNTTHSADTLVYCDNYCFVKNESIKKTCMFLEIDSENTKKTKKFVLKPNKTNSIKDNQYLLTLKNNGITPIEHNQSIKEHDRFLFIFGENQVTVWNITNSIDFIEFDTNNYTSDTIGTIKKTITFNKLHQNQIAELIKSIKQLINL